MQDGRPRPDRRRPAGRPAGAGQRHQPGRGPHQGHTLARGGRGPGAGGAGPGGRQHAGQEPHLPGQCRGRRHRAGRARAHHPDQPRGQPALAPGLGGGGGDLLVPPGPATGPPAGLRPAGSGFIPRPPQRISPLHVRHHPRHQRRQFQHQVLPLRHRRQGGAGAAPGRPARRHRHHAPAPAGARCRRPDAGRARHRPQPRARCAQWPGSRGHLAQRPPRRARAAIAPAIAWWPTAPLPSPAPIRCPRARDAASMPSTQHPRWRATLPDSLYQQGVRRYASMACPSTCPASRRSRWARSSPARPSTRA